MINQQSPPIPVPHFDGDRLSETTVLPSDIYRSFKRNLPLSTSSMPDEITKAILCQANCSGNGECRDGSCYCMIRYDGDDCRQLNFSYHVAFASIFFLLALTSLIQLAMCIHAEYLRMKKHPSILRACRITTQKFLYFAVFLAALLRGTYFAAPTVGSEWSTSLLSAYYPVVLTSASLVVCFWAEVFHLREVRWDKPRFLSKSFLGFVAFNVISYAILIAELLMVWLPTPTEENLDEEAERLKGDDRREFYAHIFNGCYAVLMFVVVIFFLIYGVEVFFKVRGGFAVSKVPNVIGSTRISSTLDGGVILDPDEVQRRRAERKERQRRRRRANSIQGTNRLGRQNSKTFDEPITNGECNLEQSPLHSLIAPPNIQTEETYHSPTSSTKRLMYNKPCQINTNDLSLEEHEAQKSLLNKNTSQLNRGEEIGFSQCSNILALERRLSSPQKNIFVVEPSPTKVKFSPSNPTKMPQDESIDKVQSCEGPSSAANVKISTIYGNDVAFDQLVNTSQLHQSRLGLLSQALMMIITVGFLFSETLEEFWKTKVDLTSRNTHDIIFRIIEIGVALWFPCVLWNCIRPEQLWCLNPKKILDRGKKFKSQFNNGAKRNDDVCDRKRGRRSSDSDMKGDHQLQRDSRETSSTDFSTSDDEEDRVLECWICYDPDRTDVGPMINPCECRGDVSAVHHDCLQRWLMEYAESSDALKCKVCGSAYMVEKGSEFSLSKGFTAKQWMQTASYVTIMCLSVGGSWAVIQLYSEAWIRTLAVGGALFVLYICLRSLGLNTVSAYQRAKVSALKIVNLRMRRTNNTTRKEDHDKDRDGAHTASPIYKPKAKKNQTELSQISNDQSRLSMDQMEPIHPSNIVKNTHKTRI